MECHWGKMSGAEERHESRSGTETVSELALSSQTIEVFIYFVNVHYPK